MTSTTSLMHAQISLPTLDKLGVKLHDDLDPKAVAAQWFNSFAQNVESGNAVGVVDLLAEDAFWRDMLSMTWEFRTFLGHESISKFLKDTLVESSLANLKLKEDSVQLEKPYPDLAWIQGLFTFETRIGIGSGVFRLIPVKVDQWKAHVVYTNLEDLKGFPEKLGRLRNPIPVHGKWPASRQREVDFEDSEPSVIVVGAGQSGLDVAARLKVLGVPTLVVDKAKRVGDQWRGRYEALCLHDTVWWDHLPYLPFPPTWPVYTPAPKLADWLEFYAQAMELNVWTDSTVDKMVQDPTTKTWTVNITRSDGSKRTFKPGHVILAIGFAGGAINMPKIPGMDEFEGQILHSTQHKSAKDHIGKKVVVVGACTSGHDISKDYYEHGVDVTLFQRSSTYIMSTKNGMPILLDPLYSEDSPPTEISDRIQASYPNALVKLMHQRVTKQIAEADHDLLEGLKKVGFKLNNGMDGSGFLLLAWQRGGGYYLDVGASQLIIDGKIKLKNDSQIARFTKKTIVFENGSEIPADVAVFCTGFGDTRARVREYFGDAIASNLNQIWSLDKEGELNSAWRWCGIPNLYFMMGNLALCRFHSKHLALQIKAAIEGLPVKRYTE